jgi:uncharacterized protein
VLDLGLAALIGCAVAVFVGAVVQGTVGFGLALIAAPVLILVEPRLVPVGLIVVTGVMPWTTLLQEWKHVDWGGIRWSMAGRVLGTAVGVWLVAALSQNGIGVLVGVAVLLAIAVSVAGLHLDVTRPRLVVAGALGGVGGTATAIGGPPLAVLYQHASGPRIRATMAAFFAFGQIMSMAALLAAGVVDVRTIVTGATLVPAMLLGAWASGLLRPHVDAGRTRPAVLALAGVSALVLLVRSVV